MGSNKTYGNIHERIQGRTGGPDPPHPLKNHENVGFPSNTGQDP